MMAPRIPRPLLARLSQSQSLSPGISRVALRHHPKLQPPCSSRAISTSSPRWQDLPTQQQPQQQPPLPPTEQTSPPPPPPPKPPRRSKVLIIVSLGIGLLAGRALTIFINPPTPPEPGTEADANTIAVIHSQAASLPIVQQLESLVASGEWQSWDAYNTLSPSHKAQHIAAGALRGSRGVGGYQRIFYHPSTGEFVSVVFFGPATAGWPGVVHGGALATLLDESCGRAAFKKWGGRSGVTAYLKVEYKKVSLANGFYVLRVKPRDDSELPEAERGKGHYKCFVDGTVEDAMSGQVTVKAEALFVSAKDGGKKKGWGIGGKQQAGGIWSRWGGKEQEENQQF
ncbi:putative mitochondrial membrane protein FMP10 [Echria macrotheca]|uniref:Mitochondrial membrane protein FMP10 n=1 Tax=Echria macrotheca TaxID=438768 RepID=A0AAJ0BIQ3_9PEZI|nr:putative mitochondrial membrane protein FMP10 [Echria macrotheca]